MAPSGVNAADKNFCPAGAPPARPRGALATSPIAPHPRSRPWGSFGESVRGAAFKSKCVTQVLNLRRGAPPCQKHAVPPLYGSDPRAFTCRAHSNIRELCAIDRVYVYTGQGQGIAEDSLYSAASGRSALRQVPTKPPAWRPEIGSHIS